MAARAPATSRSPPTRPRGHRRCCTSPAAPPGTPKGAVHVHEAVVAHHATGRYALDLHPERRLLVHRRSRLGHRHVLRHHRAADARRDQRSSTRPSSTPSAGTASSHEQRVTVWYTAPDRDPHADAGRRRARRASYDLSRAALHRQRRRAAQPRGRGLGPGGARPADPRQLVADRDRRHHDRQLRGHGHPARLDGPAAARRRGGDRRPATTRASRSSRRRASLVDRAGRRGRAGPAARLAVDVPRLPARGGALPAAASPAAGTSPATSPGATPTATSGSSAAPTT